MSPTVRAVLVVFIVAVVLVIGAGAVGVWVYVSRPPQPASRFVPVTEPTCDPNCTQATSKR